MVELTSSVPERRSHRWRRTTAAVTAAGIAFSAPMHILTPEVQARKMTIATQCHVEVNLMPEYYSADQTTHAEVTQDCYDDGTAEGHIRVQYMTNKLQAHERFLFFFHHWNTKDNQYNLKFGPGEIKTPLKYPCKKIGPSVATEYRVDVYATAVRIDGQSDTAAFVTDTMSNPCG